MTKLDKKKKNYVRDRIKEISEKNNLGLDSKTVLELSNAILSDSPMVSFSIYDRLVKNGSLTEENIELILLSEAEAELEYLKENDPVAYGNAQLLMGLFTELEEKRANGELPVWKPGDPEPGLPSEIEVIEAASMLTLDEPTEFVSLTKEAR